MNGTGLDFATTAGEAPPSGSASPFATLKRGIGAVESRGLTGSAEPESGCSRAQGDVTAWIGSGTAVLEGSTCATGLRTRVPRGRILASMKAAYPHRLSFTPYKTPVSALPGEVASLEKLLVPALCQDWPFLGCGRRTGRGTLTA